MIYLNALDTILISCGWIHDEYPDERWPKILTGISHVVYDSSHFMGSSELVHIINQFPDAETIEFKRAGLFNDFKLGRSQTPKCCSLKEFSFNYRDETQMRNLREIFKGTNTQLVPVFPNSDAN